MASGVTIGYVNFTILLLLLTGLVLLRIEVKGYELAGMKREQKAARIMAWMNISLGAATFVGNLLHRFWI